MTTSKDDIFNGLIQYFNDVIKNIQDLKITAFNEISSGWETELYTFRMTYFENDSFKEEKLVIRMYPGKSALGKLSNEFFLYTNLQKQNYPVPKIHYMSTDKKYVGKPFLIMDWIIGGTLDNMMSKNPEEATILFCKLFVELHKLDWKPFMSNLESDGENIPTIDSHIEGLEDRVIRNKLIELQPILVWLKEKRKKIGKIQLALSHFDFHPFNILLNEKGEPSVIDWPAGKVGDYRFDLGWTLTLIMVYSNREHRNGIFEAYQAIASEEIEDIDFFEVAAILRRLSDILIVFNSNAENAGLHDGVAKMIKETISHVENLNSYLEELSGIRIPAIDTLVEKVKNE